MTRTTSTAKEHLLPAIVAVVFLALALADGAHSTGVYAGVALGAWWAVILVLAIGGGSRGPVPTTAIVAGTAVFGLAALSALSMAWTGDDGSAFSQAVRAAGYAGLFALVVVTAREGDGRGWLTGIAIACAAVAVLALASRFEPSLPGGDEDIARIIPGPLARLSYPIGYWNGLAIFVAIGAVLLAWLSAVSDSRLGRSLAVGAIPLCGLTVYLASSRGGAVAGLIGFAVLVAFGRARLRLLAGAAVAGLAIALLIWLASRRTELVNAAPGPTAEQQGAEMAAFVAVAVAAAVAVRWAIEPRLRRLVVSPRVKRGALAALAVVAAAGVLLADPAERLDEFNDPPAEEIDEANFVSTHLTSGTGNGRYQYWGTAIDAFEEQPIRGIGAGAYEAYWAQHGSLDRPIRDAHSLVFESLGELGLLGLGMVAAFFGAALVGATRRPSDGPLRHDSVAALAVLVAGGAAAATDWIWEIPVVFGPVVVAAALLSGPATRREGEDRPGSRYGWGIASLVAGWLVVCASLLVLLTEVKLENSRAEVRDGDLSEAAVDARDAISLQPWSAEPRLQLALIEETAGDLAAAREDLGEAIDQDPDEWRLWLVSARIETKDGDVVAAEESLARARELNPRAGYLDFDP